MGKSRPRPVRLADLLPGQQADCFAVLAERQRGATRDGKPFFTCRFRDGRRTVGTMIWADGGFFDACERTWRVGECYKLRVIYGEHERYGPQVEIQQIRPATDDDRAEGFDPHELVERSRYDPEVMFKELWDLAAAHIADEPLRRLVHALLEQHADAWKHRPATLGKFYPFAGGLLEHTLSVARSCLWLVEHHGRGHPELKPPLNRDLVVAGAILHDVGRLVEFDDEPLAPQPTVPGRLFGHLFLGRDLVREAARAIPELNPQLLQMLEHLLIAHLNLPEWGSPRLPLIPECLIVHHADDLDAKLEMYARCLERDAEPGPFTARDPVLNRNLLKGREV